MTDKTKENVAASAQAATAKKKRRGVSNETHAVASLKSLVILLKFVLIGL